MGSHRQAMVVMGSGPSAAGLRDRLGQVLQACVASGNLIRVLVACFVLRRMPCGPGASHASVGLTALEESVCPAEVWSLSWCSICGGEEIARRCFVAALRDVPHLQRFIMARL